jgi:hypothetical protein
MGSHLLALEEPDPGVFSKVHDHFDAHCEQVYEKKCKIIRVTTI